MCGVWVCWSYFSSSLMCLAIVGATLVPMALSLVELLVKGEDVIHHDVVKMY